MPSKDKLTQWFIFNTKYVLDSHHGTSIYNSFVVAKSKQHAIYLIKKRCIGEYLDNKSKPSKFTNYKFKNLFLIPSLAYLQDKYLECMHGVIFLSWICGKSEVLDATNTLKDTGVLHEILHKKMFGDDGDGSIHYGKNFDKYIMTLLKELERKTPGLLPK